MWGVLAIAVVVAFVVLNHMTRPNVVVQRTIQTRVHRGGDWPVWQWPNWRGGRMPRRTPNRMPNRRRDMLNRRAERNGRTRDGRPRRDGEFTTKK